MSSSRCMFCNSASHSSHLTCNSNMKGRRDRLIKMAESMMTNDTRPDFSLFTINELRFIAFHYMQTELFNVRMRKNCPSQLSWDSSIVRYLRSPILLTQTKTRLVTDLNNRWGGYDELRSRMRAKPEEEDCPICLECMVVSRWRSSVLRWGSMTNITMPVRNVITRCRHKFCGSCWNLHVDANTKSVVEFINGVRMIQKYVACPMCRTTMQVARPTIFNHRHDDPDDPYWGYITG